MPNGIQFGQQPQQANPNIQNILRALGAALPFGQSQVAGLATRGINQLLPPQAPPQALPAGAPPIGGITPQTAIGTRGQVSPLTAAPTPEPEDKKKGGIFGFLENLSDPQRALLGAAIKIGIPLALAGFGGRTGLSAGAGLAGGFAEAEKLRQQQLFTIDPSTGQLTAVGAIPKGSKVVTKRKEKETEDETLKAIETLLGAAPEAKITPATAGKEKATEIRKLTEKAKQLPAGIDPNRFEIAP